MIDHMLCQLFSRDVTAQDLVYHPPLQPQDDASHVLVIAVDDARALRVPQPTIDWLLCFRNALVHANDHLRSRYGASSGVFGLVVDPGASGQKTEDDSSLGRKWFAPFVLTDTVDVSITEGIERTNEEIGECFKQRVLSALAHVTAREDAGAARALTTWKELCELGRPLWKTRTWRRKELIDTAAQLLMGPNVDGVGWLACALCRLGIRPRVTTPLAMTLVADHMAVLSDARENKDGFIVSYNSDPTLTLGAVQQWHDRAKESNEANLSQWILPQLITTLNQEDVLMHTGDRSDIVARILLLLAMDACAVLESGKTRMRWEGAGEMYHVETFLLALGGTEAHGQRTLDDKWSDWFVSFTHFVEFSETPSEADLWCLLGRRAAGVLPQGHRGADLIIPMCRLDASSAEKDSPTKQIRTPRTAPQTREGRISMILVEVKNYRKGFSSYIKTVLKILDPKYVFPNASPLSSMPLDAVLRVVLSPGDLSDPQQHVYVDDPRTPGSFALCVVGLSTMVV